MAVLQHQQLIVETINDRQKYTNSNYKQPLYGHYASQPVLAGSASKKRRILLEQSFTTCMSLLTATSLSLLGRKR